MFRASELRLAFFVAAACLGPLLVSTSAQAQWVWRTPGGGITASDRPPPAGVADKDVIRRPAVDNKPKTAAKDATAATAASAAAGAASAAAPARAASAPMTALEKEVLARKQAAERDRLAKAKADEDRVATERAGNCKAARGALAALESGIRMVRANEKGEREVMDDRARAEETRRAQDAVSSNCR